MPLEGRLFLPEVRAAGSHVDPAAFCLEGAALSAPKYLGHDGACPSK